MALPIQGFWPRLACVHSGKNPRGYTCARLAGHWSSAFEARRRGEGGLTTFARENLPITTAWELAWKNYIWTLSLYLSLVSMWGGGGSLSLCVLFRSLTIYSRINVFNPPPLPPFLSARSFCLIIQTIFFCLGLRTVSIFSCAPPHPPSPNEFQWLFWLTPPSFQWTFITTVSPSLWPSFTVFQPMKPLIPLLWVQLTLVLIKEKL
jgi:hypothetical protein